VSDLPSKEPVVSDEDFAAIRSLVRDFVRDRVLPRKQEIADADAIPDDHGKDPLAGEVIRNEGARVQIPSAPPRAAGQRPDPGNRIRPQDRLAAFRQRIRRTPLNSDGARRTP
jgi:hypothetical protein